MASTRIHIDEARLGRVQKQDRFATGVLTAIVAIVMLIVISMVAYILFEGISTLFQPGFLTEPSRANGTQGGVLYQLFDSFYLLLITLIISVPISLGGAVFLVEYAPDGPIRDIASTAIETLSSLPSIVVGMFGFLVFSVQLGWTPVSGRLDILYDPPKVTGLMLIDAWLSGEEGAFRSAASHLILPTIALGTIPLATLARMTRSAMLEVLREDYIRAARAKGLSPFRVVVKHALRNALIPVVTVLGLQVGVLMGGAVLTETIFAWPGIGKWLIEAIHRRDYPVVQGGILLTAMLVIIVNLVVDLLYGVINPRIRHPR